MAGAAVTKGGCMTLRVVLIGKTGAGKSSLGNTLLGSKKFKVGRGMNSETVDCDWANGEHDGIDIQVTDTPGLCDTHRKEAEVYLEVGRSVALAAPGPHVILMVLRCDKRFTKEEYKAYLALKMLFSDKICEHMIVVFNGLDTFQSDDEDEEEGSEALKQEIAKGSPELQQVLQDANQRYIGVNNKAKKEEKIRQFSELLRTLMELVTSNGERYYSTDWSKNIAQKVEELIKQQMEEKDQTHDQAEWDIKKDISSGRVSKLFLATIAAVVESTVSGLVATWDMVASICKQS